jgi:hypothetical protein
MWNRKTEDKEALFCDIQTAGPSAGHALPARTKGSVSLLPLLATTDRKLLLGEILVQGELNPDMRGHHMRVKSCFNQNGVSSTLRCRCQDSAQLSGSCRF